MIQKSTVFAFGVNGTQTLVAAGSGAIINGLSVMGIITAAAITTIGVFALTDGAGVPVVLLQRNLVGTTNIGDFIHLSGLYIPTTSTGGLIISISSLVGGAFIVGTVFYSTP